jgi:hypothetical protein
MKHIYLILRSTLIWIVSAVHFFTVCTFLVLLGIFFDPRWNEGLDALNPAVHDLLDRGQRFYLQHTGDGPASSGFPL